MPIPASVTGTAQFPMTATTNERELNHRLRHALNLLKALDAGGEDELPSDRRNLANELAHLAAHIGAGGMAPDAISIIKEAASIPIQR